MNVYEAIKEYLYNSGWTQQADNSRNVLRALVDAYDALKPDWANAPDWAQWYVIDADGEATLYAREPAYDSDGWHVIGVTNLSYCESVNLPLGIDWRLCKWSRGVGS